MAPHMFLASGGDLHDTRLPDWAAAPLRAGFSRHVPRIESVSHLKATLRAGAHTFPGCYPLALLTHDGESLCFDCGRREFRQIAESIRTHARDGWRVVACDIAHAEESDDSCAHCGAVIAAHID